jgi:hypothetical protein
MNTNNGQNRKAAALVARELRAAERVLARRIINRDAYHSRTGISRNAYSREGERREWAEKDARRGLAVALGFPHAFDTLGRTEADDLVNTAIWSDFTTWARADHDYKEACRDYKSGKDSAQARAAKLAADTARADYDAAIEKARARRAFDTNIDQGRAMRERCGLDALPPVQPIIDRIEKEDAAENVPCPICGAKYASSADAAGVVQPCADCANAATADAIDQDAKARELDKMREKAGRLADDLVKMTGERDALRERLRAVAGERAELLRALENMNRCAENPERPGYLDVLGAARAVERKMKGE